MGGEKDQLFSVNIKEKKKVYPINPDLYDIL